MIRYAICLLGDEELFGYIETEVKPTVDILLDCFEGESTQAYIASVDPWRWQFNAVH